MTFAALFVSEKRDKRKSYFMFLRGRTMFAPTREPKRRQQSKQKIKSHPLFLLHIQAQKKKLSKRKRRHEISRSAERDKSCALLMSAPFKKGARKLYWRAKTFVEARETLSVCDTKKVGVRYEKRKSPRISFFVFTYCRGLYAPRGDLLSYRKRRHFFRPPARRYQPFSYSAPHKGHASA